MSDLGQTLAAIENALTERDPTHELTLIITRRLASLPSSQTKFLSYISLANLAEVDSSDERLIYSISVLTSPTVNVLSVMFVYIGEGETTYVLSPSEFARAKTAGFLIDPHTGEERADFLDTTYPHFKTTLSFASLQARQ